MKHMFILFIISSIALSCNNLSGFSSDKTSFHEATQRRLAELLRLRKRHLISCADNSIYSKQTKKDKELLLKVDSLFNLIYKKSQDEISSIELRDLNATIGCMVDSIVKHKKLDSIRKQQYLSDQFPLEREKFPLQAYFLENSLIDIISLGLWESAYYEPPVTISVGKQIGTSLEGTIFYGIDVLQYSDTIVVESLSRNGDEFKSNVIIKKMEGYVQLSLPLSGAGEYWVKGYIQMKSPRIVPVRTPFEIKKVVH